MWLKWKCLYACDTFSQCQYWLLVNCEYDIHTCSLKKEGAFRISTSQHNGEVTDMHLMYVSHKQRVCYCITHWGSQTENRDYGKKDVLQAICSWLYALLDKLQPLSPFTWVSLACALFKIRILTVQGCKLKLTKSSVRMTTSFMPSSHKPVLCLL